MTELTQEQRKTIEDAFASLPLNAKTGNFGSMEGIEKQLEYDPNDIFYLSYKGTEGEYTIHRMKMKEND